MATLIAAESGALITRFVTLRSSQEVLLTVQTTLDGTEYLTRFGAPVVTYELEVYVNETGKALLEAAADSLELLSVTVRRGTYTGRIKSIGSFEPQVHGWYKNTLLLSASGEVVDL